LKCTVPCFRRIEIDEGDDFEYSAAEYVLVDVIRMKRESESMGKRNTTSTNSTLGRSKGIQARDHAAVGMHNCSLIVVMYNNYVR